MGLSAHLAGVQNGMVLLIFGLMWHHLKVGEVWRKLARWLSIFSMYAIWFGLLLAAVWGTSKSTPIAGAGYEGSETQELVVSALIQVGSVAISSSALRPFRVSKSLLKSRLFKSGGATGRVSYIIS